MTTSRTRISAVVVDSGLRSYGGHNYFYTRAVQHALARRGIRVTVLANRGLPREMAESEGFTPTFTVGSHDHPLGAGLVSDLAYVYAQSVVFAHELGAALAACGRSEQRLVFSHTVADFELIGWRHHVRRRDFSGQLMLLQRVTPGFASMSVLTKRLHPYLRIKPHYVRALRRRLGSRFTLLTDSETLSADYSRIHPRVVTLPIPVDPALLEPADRAVTESIVVRHGLQRAKGLRVVYLGDARSTKGFHLLPRALSQLLLRTGDRAHFIIQTSWAGQGRGDADAPEGIPEIRELARRNASTVTLMTDRLEPRDYAELLRQTEIVLLPYLTDFYREATSGIFAEALALGRVVVVSSDTWMARQLSRSGGGVVFARGDAADLAKKLLEAVDRHEEYALRAQAFSSEWRRFHNPDTLVDILLAEAGITGLGAEAEASSRRSGWPATEKGPRE